MNFERRAYVAHQSGVYVIGLKREIEAVPARPSSRSF